MKETEVRIPENFTDSSEDNFRQTTPVEKKKVPQKSILGYPADWMHGFGSNYYSHAQARELAEFANNKNWKTSSEGQPYKNSDIQASSKKDIEENIEKIIEEMKETQNE